MRITYAKLKDGETWGVRVQDGQVAEGQRVQVWTKAGKAVEETILKVVSQGQGYQICQVVPKARRGGARPAAAAPQCCPHCGKDPREPVRPQAPQQPTRAVGQWQQQPRQAPARAFPGPQGYTPPPPPEEPPQRWNPGYAAF
jgi:hypothetical protein